MSTLDEKAISYTEQEFKEGKLGWRHIVELAKYWQAGHDLKVDGWAGPITQSTIEALWEDSPMPDEDWSAFDGPLEEQPTNRRAVYKAFGNPGSGAPDKDWERAQVVECHPRYGNQLPGVPSQRYVRVHRLVEPYLREGLRRAEFACPSYEIERIGCYVFRHQRHDPKRPLSYHSWGIAVDIDPHLNHSKVLSSSVDLWDEQWMEIWPNGLPEEFVQAMESCGWHWGGYWSRFRDCMHFQWVGEAQV